MFIRTYTRTLFNNIFKNNFLMRFLSKIVNFYCELKIKPKKEIKFLTNMPIANSEEKKHIFFQSVTGDEIDCK